MAAGGQRLEALPEYAAYIQAETYALALEAAGKAEENGSELGNLNIYYQAEAWKKVIPTIDILLAKNMLADERTLLEAIRREILNKIGILENKIMLRQIKPPVKNAKNANEASIFPHIPTTMPENIPRTSQELTDMVRKLAMEITIPKGKTVEAKKETVDKAVDTFEKYFLTNWENTKGKMSKKGHLLPFTQNKDALAYFQSVIDGQLKFLAGIKDFRTDALGLLSLKIKY